MSGPTEPAGLPAPGGEPGPPDAHPALTFDEIVHQRTRLGILAVLAEAGEADFPYLRRVLALTDGNLGRHLQILEDAGLIMISKGYHRRRPRTWATITSEGRHALDHEVANMRALVRRLDSVANQPDPASGRGPSGSGGPHDPAPAR
jgi:DNA-binding MarR family transcriptional regulator